MSITIPPRPATSTRAARWRDTHVVVVVLALLVATWLELQGSNLADWGIEARPSVNALLAGHPGDFFRLAPAYGGSLLLRAPFMVLAHLCGGGRIAVYWASVAPCQLAAGALAIWLSERLRRRTGTATGCVVTICLCIASPFAVMAVQQAHPEELLGAVLCVAAVCCAQRDRAAWSGVLLGLAIVNKPWAILAVGPVLVALHRDRSRAIASMALTTGMILAPFMLVRAGGFVAQTTAVGLHAGTLFNPWQLWWFTGTRDAAGAQIGPAWLASIGHTLPVAIMAPLSLAYAICRRRSPTRRRDDAMLLLALLLFLRCALDPWDTVYYPLPFLTALLVWEATTYDRVPFAAAGATLLTWFVFQGATYSLGQGSSLAALFAVVTLPALGAIGHRLLARSDPVARSHTPAASP